MTRVFDCLRERHATQTIRSPHQCHECPIGRDQEERPTVNRACMKCAECRLWSSRERD
jgi:hypothetical protein